MSKMFRFFMSFIYFVPMLSQCHVEFGGNTAVIIIIISSTNIFFFSQLGVSLRY